MPISAGLNSVRGGLRAGAPGGATGPSAGDRAPSGSFSGAGKSDGAPSWPMLPAPTVALACSVSEAPVPRGDGPGPEPGAGRPIPSRAIGSTIEDLLMSDEPGKCGSARTNRCVRRLLAGKHGHG